MFCPLCNLKLLKSIEDKSLYTKVKFCPSPYEWVIENNTITSHYEFYPDLKIELIYIKPFHITNDLVKNITRIYSLSTKPFSKWKFISQS